MSQLARKTLIPSNALRKDMKPARVVLKAGITRVRDSHGEEHHAATLIKALHKAGGQPLQKARP